jgi:DNA gyrase subunit A
MGASVPVHQIPQVHAAADGTPPRDVSALGQADEVAAMLSIGPNTGEGYLFLATVHGEVKRIRLDDLPGLMANQFKVIDIEPGDRLLTAFVTTGDDEVILTTAQAQAIRFREADVRATTMGTGGMRGIKLTAEPLLNTNDHVIGAGVVHKGDVLWTIADNGIAKQSPIDEFPTQGRAGAGVIAMKLPPDSAGLAAAVCGAADEQVVIITSKGKPKQVRLGAAVSARRAGKGESVIALFAKEQVMTVMMFQRAQAALPEAARASAVET